MADPNLPQQQNPPERHNFLGMPESHPVARAIAGIQVEGYEHLDPANYDFERCWTRTHRDAPYLKDDVVAAIVVTGGDLTGMAMLLGRNRERVKQFVLGNPDIRDIFLGVEQSFLDIIERVGRVQALMGDSTQIRFFLSTVGKDRGYTTRTEQTGKDGQPLHPDYSTYTEEQLERLAAIHAEANANGK